MAKNSQQWKKFTQNMHKPNIIIAVYEEISPKNFISQIAVMKESSKNQHKPTIQLMQNLDNATFSQNQKLHYARILCSGKLRIPVWFITSFKQTFNVKIKVSVTGSCRFLDVNLESELLKQSPKNVKIQKNQIEKYGASNCTI